jgi:PAS domain S-box-containing protein
MGFLIDWPIFFLESGPMIDSEKSKDQLIQELKRMRNMLSEVQKISQLGIFEFDISTQQAIWSAEQFRIYGLDPGCPSPSYEAILKSVHPDDKSLAHETFMSAVQRGAVYKLDHRILQSDGSERWVHEQAYPYFDENGKLARYIGTTLDITDRKRTEEALRQTLERLHLAHKAAHSGKWEWDLQTNENEWSDELWDLYGLVPHSCSPSGEIWMETIHPDDRESVSQAVLSASSARSELAIEWRVITRDGSERWLMSRGEPVQNPDGRGIRYVGIVLDITDRKQLEAKLHQSEAKHRHLFETMAQGVVYQNREGQIISANPAAERILGLSIVQNQGRASIEPRWKSIHEDGSEFLGETHPAMMALQTGNPVDDIVMGVFNPEREETRWIVINAVPQFMGNEPAPYQVYTTFTDITERKRAEDDLKRYRDNLELLVKDRTLALTVANTQLESEIKDRRGIEEALRWSESKFRSVVENISDGILFIDRNLVVSYRSPSYFHLNGYTDEERLEYSGLETVFPEDRERISLLWNQLVNQPGLTLTAQYRILHKNGSVRWLESVAQNLLDHPDLKQIIVVSRDITDRKQTEEELDRIINLVPDLICTASTDGYFKKITPAWERTLGFTADELLSKPYSEFIHPDDLTPTLSEIEKQINGHSTISFVSRYRCKDGTYKWLEWNATPSSDGILLYTSARDITDRRRLEAELKESEARWKFALEGSGDGVWDWDVLSNRVYYSPKWKRMLGYEVDEVIDSLDEWEKRVHIEDKEGVYAELERHFRGETPSYESEHRLLCKDGSYKWILDRGKIMEWTAEGDPKRMVGLHTDISGRKQMEQERIILDKLESTGLLAGGIAHDFNNLLGVILGNLDMVNMFECSEEEKHISLEEIRKATLEAKRLTKQFITLAQGGDPVKKLFSLSELLEEQVPFVLRGSRVDSEISIPKDLRTVVGDEGQIGQIVRNLMLNALEASPDGGKVSVVAENIENASASLKPIESGKYIKVSISDQGNGIPTEIFQKIFNPYFSTKERGPQKGMGLGLTICHSILQKHGGMIDIESKPGKGTTVYFYLPASEESIAEKSLTREIISGKGRILVMDDEESVRNMLEAILKRLGYQVESVKNGETAIESYQTAQKAGQPFTAIILDLTVRGGMGGKETLKKLLEVDPEAIAIVSSGYSEDPVVQNFWEYGFKGALIKPFFIDELAKMLSGVIKSS